MTVMTPNLTSMPFGKIFGFAEGLSGFADTDNFVETPSVASRVYQDAPDYYASDITATNYDVSIHFTAPTFLQADINAVLSLGIGVDFEDGMDSEFESALRELLLSYGSWAVDSLREQIDYIDPSILRETAKIFGDVEQKSSHLSRLLFLLDCLNHTSPLVRDGGVLGLAEIGNSYSLPFVKKAAKQESFHLLKRQMDELINELRGK